MGVFFQGLDQNLNDQELVTQQLSLADNAEGLGFQSIWTAEHHFTDYHMMPNPAQFLTYMAARTKTVRLGTMVMVVPWHDPIRVAEELSWLDAVSGGRTVLGMGRGLGSIEFDNFRLEMGESRQRFVEYATAISNSLESGWIESDGELYKQPKAAIKPAPSTTFRGRTYASAVSPESAKIMAKLGYGLMLIAQKPWKTVVEETQQYRDLFVEINGHEPPQPVLVNYTTVHEDAERAQEMHDEFTMAYARSTVEHYEFTNPRLQTVNGYEYYAGLSKNIEKHGLEKFNKFLADLQISGTPESVLEQTVERVRALNAGGVINVLAYGGMSRQVAEEQTALYASKVLPRLREIDTHRDICVPSVPMATVGG
ncbi:LLM class flavin-dependent oxidoreductase [Rhodococcus sp. ACS1]|uniref:LLM class flavin-dependent oxidoreductase n=1 Tax=Rhodococcus sp. ACS1 TaxID=2028570 RepID=UPI001C52D8C0|nr:LLM class flavin-dependent oxidoreductase [Rhodococcus sp. ACS1]